ncbi:TetR/AcrR family transcriptional regulator [Paractinoplanes brasiliensis]|nr:helix-turn-helix domain-containing protein [Actinoplanes brasiliensis]GID26012.1 TetR family transcriptional regulator [Actinoplanes brasiliensis]
MTPRRSDALSRERIVEAAVRILDTKGEGGLTLRAVTAHLSTGRGAIYHHVTNKEELLAAAADDVIRAVVTGDSVRDLALGIFDAIDVHPWLGAQLARDPSQPAVLRIFKSVGVGLRTHGLAGTALSDAGAALVNYVLGAAAQHAAGARQAAGESAREDYLEALAAEWAGSDDDPLVQEAAALLPGHDDRAQFLAGVDIFLRGISG